MEKQYSEWAVWARESLTTWKETKQTQPKGDLKDTKIWSSFQSFYNRFHWEFWVQNSSSIFTMIVCHISWHSPSLNDFPLFFLRSSSSLWTKYLPFRIRWNINILWHKRDGHLTQSVCSGNKLWREINKALMKKEWRHQFWPQTVISRWNQWISRVLL